MTSTPTTDRTRIGPLLVPAPRSSRLRMRNRALLLGLLLCVGGGRPGPGRPSAPSRSTASLAASSCSADRRPATSRRPSVPNPSRTRDRPGNPGTARLRLGPSQAKALGLDFATVRLQTEPTTLELLGTTEYDPNTLIKVRPRFDTLVSKVLVSVGQTVRKGDPLIELDSVALAEAKLAFEERTIQWEYDRRLLDRHRPCTASSRSPSGSTRRRSARSGRAGSTPKVAREKLAVYRPDPGADRPRRKDETPPRRRA